MRTYIAFPPLHKNTGGINVLRDIAIILASAGYDVAVVPREKGVLPDFSVSDNLQIIPFAEALPKNEDVWLVPEGWPALLLPGLKNMARTVIYVQNWAYLPSSVPSGSQLAKLPVHFLAVSWPCAWHIEFFYGKKAEILRPGIDLNLFYPPERDSYRGLELGQSVRIAFMPRKNKALARQIKDMLEARLILKGKQTAEWVQIHNVSRERVAEIMRTCHIFLVTGFPEGCPLPPLEAMACGLIPVGFTGFGGLDYMRQIEPDAFVSPLPPRTDGDFFGGNGFYVADADSVSAALCLERALDIVQRGGEKLALIRAEAEKTARFYSHTEQKKTLLALWRRVYEGLALTSFLC